MLYWTQKKTKRRLPAIEEVITMMKAAAINTAFDLDSVRIARPSLLRSLGRFFTAMLETRDDEPFGLPADKAARLYL